jgi:hypothetical protein
MTTPVYLQVFLVLVGLAALVATWKAYKHYVYDPQQEFQESFESLRRQSERHRRPPDLNLPQDLARQPIGVGRVQGGIAPPGGVRPPQPIPPPRPALPRRPGVFPDRPGGRPGF